MCSLHLFHLIYIFSANLTWDCFFGLMHHASSTLPITIFAHQSSLYQSKLFVSYNYMNIDMSFVLYAVLSKDNKVERLLSGLNLGLSTPIIMF